MTDSEYKQYLNVMGWKHWFYERLYKRNADEVSYCGYSEFNAFAWVLPMEDDGDYGPENLDTRDNV